MPFPPKVRSLDDTVRLIDDGANVIGRMPLAAPYL